jgi:hypothetical protein
MDYLPPGRVVKVGNPRWSRFIIVDGLDQVWAGKGRWSDNPADAVLFYREIDATKTRNHHCLGGDEAETFTATIVITVHARRWSGEELARHLQRHRKFFIGGPTGKEGLLLEICPDTLRKAEP